VLERAAGGRWSIRLRLDGLARFSPRAQAHLPALIETVQACSTTMLLGPGEGVLLDNTRWLHGRRPFTGERALLRVLGEARTHLPLSRGFSPSWALPTE